MVRRFISSAMRSSIEEILGRRLDEMNGSLKRLESRVDAVDVRLGERIDDCIRQTVALGARLDSRIDEMGARLGTRIDEMGARIDEMGARLDSRIDEMGTRLETRIDEMGARLGTRIDEMGARLDSRIDDMGDRIDGVANRFSAKFDEFSGQQVRLIEEVVNLKGEVSALRTEQKVVDTLEHRVARIEDRLFAKAG